MHNLDEFTAQSKAAVTAREGQTTTRGREWKRFRFGEVMTVSPQGIAGYRCAVCGWGSRIEGFVPSAVVIVYTWRHIRYDIQILLKMFHLIYWYKRSKGSHAQCLKSALFVNLSKWFCRTHVEAARLLWVQSVSNTVMSLSNVLKKAESYDAIWVLCGP